jgi:hypothetical protein
MKIGDLVKYKSPHWRSRKNKFYLIIDILSHDWIKFAEDPTCWTSVRGVEFEVYDASG